MEFGLNAKVLLCQTHSQCGHRTPVEALGIGAHQGFLVCFDHILCGAATHLTPWVQQTLQQVLPGGARP